MNKDLKKLTAKIQKTFGEEMVSLASERKDRDINVHTTGSLMLDLAIGGGDRAGIPEGRIMEIYGPESQGKCLTKDAWISTPQGLKTIERIFEENGTPVETTEKVVPAEIELINKYGEVEKTGGITFNGMKSVLKVTTKTGKELKVTKNHPLLVLGENEKHIWKEANELFVGDLSVGRFNDQIFGTNKTIKTEDEAYFLGALLAHSYVDNSVLIIKHDEQEIVDYLIKHLESIDSEAVKSLNIPEENNEIHLVSKHKIDAYLENVGFPTGNDKFIPQSIMSAPKSIQLSFLSAYFESAVSTDKPQMKVTNTNKELLVQLQLLLNNLGVVAILSEGSNGQFELVIPGKHYLKLLSGLYFKTKEVSANRHDILLGKNGLFDNYLSDEITKFLTIDNYIYDEIVSIKELESEPTFDVCMPETHSFIANGIINHNTTIVLLMIAARQAEEEKRAEEDPSYEKKYCVFVDAEHALDFRLAEEYGVNLDELIYINPETAEEAMDVLDAYIRSGMIAIAAIDSVPALLPSMVEEASYKQQHMAVLARFMSNVIQKITGPTFQHKTTLIFINQVREKVGGFSPHGGTPEITPGGRALKFYSSVRLSIRRGDIIKRDGEQVGHVIKVRTIKNKIATPYKEAVINLVYGKGIDRADELFQIALRADIIKRGGAWYTCVDDNGEILHFGGEEMRTQGKDNMIEHIREIPEFFTYLENIVRGVSVELEDMDEEQMKLVQDEIKGQ